MCRRVFGVHILRWCYCWGVVFGVLIQRRCWFWGVVIGAHIQRRCWCRGVVLGFVLDSCVSPEVGSDIGLYCRHEEDLLCGGSALRVTPQQHPDQVLQQRPCVPERKPEISV